MKNYICVFSVLYGIKINLQRLEKSLRIHTEDRVCLIFYSVALQMATSVGHSVTWGLSLLDILVPSSGLLAAEQNKYLHGAVLIRCLIHQRPEPLTLSQRLSPNSTRIAHLNSMECPLKAKNKPIEQCCNATDDSLWDYTLSVLFLAWINALLHETWVLSL